MTHSIDIISFETTSDLRDATENYWTELQGFAVLLPGAHRFARSYLGQPDAALLERITPVMRAEPREGKMTPPEPEGLSIAVDDNQGRARLNLQVELGRGAMPAVIVGPRVYQLEDKAEGLRSLGLNEMERALTECEGRGLLLDVFAATKYAIRRRADTPLSRMLQKLKS